MKQYCDKFFTFILFCLIFFTGCSSLKYEKIIKQASSYNWYQNMDDANKSLQLLEEAIKIDPHKWDAYFQEIQIYATWEHKSENFVSNQEAVKEVYDRWINNGNEFNEIQQFCYANTLTSLGQIKQSNPIYYELFNKFRIKNLEEISSEEFFIYVMCGIMIDEITMNNYDEFIKNHNEYEIYKEVLPQEFDEINKYGKESLAKRYCAK